MGGAHALDDFLFTLRSHKDIAERAFAQLDDAQWHWAPDDDANSIAIIVKHMAGNMRSRWTDFLTTDGEKPDRNRDTEFENAGVNPDDVREQWAAGWQCVFEAIEPLRADDLAKTVTIRGREHTVMQAILRQIAHYSYHIGQIVVLARMQRGSSWKTLSIARGESAAYRPDGRL